MNLVSSTISEDQRFDFKSGSLARNPGAVESISKHVSAFANSDGGFLIFGVEQRDRKGSGWMARPMERTSEFTQLFDQKVAVEPPVPYPSPKEVPVGEGNAFYVVHVPASKLGPHASVARGGCVFYERTHEGSVPMSYVHLRESMLGQESRRISVRVLINELDEAFRLAYCHIKQNYSEPDSLDFTPYDLSLAKDAAVRLHSQLSNDGNAMEKLMLAFRAQHSLNAVLTVAALQVGTLGARIGSSWGRRIQPRAEQAAKNLNEARLALGRVFNEDVGDWYPGRF